MAVYTYYLADLMTNAILAELDCTGVYLDRFIGKPGNGGFTVSLDDQRIPNEFVVEATHPGRTAWYVDRDGVIIWAGIVWSRTYQAQSKTLQMTAQTFESYPKRHVMRVSKTYVNQLSMNIMADLWNSLQHDESYSDLGIQIPANQAGGQTSTNLTVASYEFKTYQDAMDAITDIQYGCEYYIDVQWSGNSAVRSLVLPSVNATLTPGGIYPVGRTTGFDLTFEYPGNILNYWWPDSATKAGTRFIALGAGEGSAMKYAIVQSSSQLNSGYPLYDLVESNKDINDQAAINAMALAMQSLNGMPVQVPTFQLRADEEPVFGSYSLGDRAFFQIVDPRFPTGMVASQRILGWTITPRSSDEQEMIQLVFEGQDDSG